MGMMSSNKRKTTRGRGAASVLAMLFLILFSVLALGFYSVITTSVRVASADHQVTKALLAAESGMEFMRYYLSLLSIPGNTTDGNLVSAVSTDLQPLLNPTANMNGATVAVTDAMDDGESAGRKLFCH